MNVSIKKLLDVSNVLFFVVLFLSLGILYILLAYEIEDVTKISGYITQDSLFRFHYGTDTHISIDTNTNVTIMLLDTTIVTNVTFVDTVSNYGLCTLGSGLTVSVGETINATVNTGTQTSIGKIMIIRYFQ